MTEPVNPYLTPIRREPEAEPSLASRVPPPPRVPSPRQTRLFGATGVPAIVFGLIWLALGAAITSVAAGRNFEDLVLSIASRKTDGVITSRTIVQNTRVNRVHPTALGFTFSVDGVTHVALSHDLSPPASLAKGKAVRVEYLGFAPDCARIVGTTRATAGYVTLFILVFPSLGVLVLSLAIAARVQRARRARAFRSGVAAIGTIVSYGELRHRRREEPQYEIVWQFVDAAGQTRRGSARADESDFAGEMGVVGREVVVLYDPARPKDNVLYVD